MEFDTLREMMAEEGLRLYVYDDATGDRIVPGYKVIGHPTIGIGRALDVHGISIAEASFLLDDDVAAINAELEKFAWWLALSPARQFVVMSMTFNMGLSGMLAFSDMIAALTQSNFDRAADAMLNSKWERQVPVRAHRLAEAMRVGHLPS